MIKIPHLKNLTYRACPYLNAKSTTVKVFTKETQTQNHCQIGNFGLALDTMTTWIKEKT